MSIEVLDVDAVTMAFPASVIGTYLPEMKDIPEDIIQAMEDGELSIGQLHWLVCAEAEHLGLSLEEAIELHNTHNLPHCHIGSDLDFLLEMWMPHIID